MDVYTGNVCKSQSLHIIYDLLYYIFLTISEALSFVLNLFVHFQYLGKWPTDNIINQIVIIPQII